MKIEIITTPTFYKEFKRLKKKYVSLTNDLLLFEKELNENPKIGDDLGSEVYVKMRTCNFGRGKLFNSSNLDEPKIFCRT
jgi:hypothetical protein